MLKANLRTALRMRAHRCGAGAAVTRRPIVLEAASDAEDGVAAVAAGSER
jgi:hypothetical protein